MKLIKTLAIFAFLVQLHTGQQLFIKDAVGFVIVERDIQGEVQPVHVFFDKKQGLCVAIPSQYIRVAVYLPENGVM